MKYLSSLKNKHAAMELSMSTIVVVILSVTFLVLAIVLIKDIFSGAKNAVNLSNKQLISQINKLFSDNEAPVVIYPQSGVVSAKQGKLQEVGVGIRNLGTASGSDTFSYEVKYDSSDVGKESCPSGKSEPINWIAYGGSGTGIIIRNGGFSTNRIGIKVPIGSALCIARFDVEISKAGAAENSISFYVQSLPK